MKKFALLFSMLFLTACGSSMDHSQMMDDDPMASMPCHAMPDGTMMGDCDEQGVDHSMMDMGKQEVDGERYSQDVSGLPLVKASETVVLEDGDTYEIVASPVKMEIEGKMIRMLAYNGSVPGPILRVPQGAQINVMMTNDVDVETLLHSHGLRLENAFDGTSLVQDPIQVGESFEYQLSFPDAGAFWYHPHIREDYTQESGLYGNFIVEPKEEAYWADVDREEILVLDDIFLEEEGLVPFYKDFGTHALMGRFGNVMLTNGQTDYQLELKQGENVRFFVTNVSNTRTFRFAVGDLKMKLVGGDASKYEREEWVDTVDISPSERVVLEIFFDDAGELLIKNINPQSSHELGKIIISEASHDADHGELRVNDDVIADIDQYRQFFDKEVDKTLSFSIDMEGMGEMMHGMSHADEGVEWEDAMAVMNEQSSSESVKWKLVDEETKKENMDIDWDFQEGDVVKIRLFNDPDSMHPMQHPFHLHGQRFLVLDVNDERQENLAWKDTVMVRTGDTVDILVDMSNPGKWMGHCHIAEHLESGMMLGFTVVKSD